MQINGVNVRGVRVDEKTRCAHYNTDRDIIAIKFKCCHTYYPCHLCHEEMADHPAIQWGMDERDQVAILCGGCGTELTINEYMDSRSGSASACPNCHASFNEGCRNHYHLYF
ncbi:MULTISPECIES: CHY zinc finger protein [Bacillaceae]|uniref:CHY-type domain-containing protein n=1 Tax=Evansella alkalicola TaxID=745819 RepID=A0ABS6JXG3_9BACI|nr:MULTISPECIES: CHY zinc finger protein [Bacillaceae]MBU9723268.1 hypothetical protein [Bacillus alkalicola]